MLAQGCRWSLRKRRERIGHEGWGNPAKTNQPNTLSGAQSSINAMQQWRLSTRSLSSHRASGSHSGGPCTNRACVPFPRSRGFELSHWDGGKKNGTLKHISRRHMRCLRTQGKRAAQPCMLAQGCRWSLRKKRERIGHESWGNPAKTEPTEHALRSAIVGARSLARMLDWPVLLFPSLPNQQTTSAASPFQTDIFVLARDCLQ